MGRRRFLAFRVHVGGRLAEEEDGAGRPSVRPGPGSAGPAAWTAVFSMEKRGPMRGMRYGAECAASQFAIDFCREASYNAIRS